jgi:hypothetical protein
VDMWSIIVISLCCYNAVTVPLRLGFSDLESPVGNVASCQTGKVSMLKFDNLFTTVTPTKNAPEPTGSLFATT